MSEIVTHTFDGVYWTASVGDYDLGDPCGSGLSEREAIDDLMGQLEIEIDRRGTALKPQQAGPERD